MKLDIPPALLLFFAVYGLLNLITDIRWFVKGFRKGLRKEGGKKP